MHFFGMFANGTYKHSNQESQAVSEAREDVRRKRPLSSGEPHRFKAMALEILRGRR